MYVLLLFFADCETESLRPRIAIRFLFAELATLYVYFRGVVSTGNGFCDRPCRPMVLIPSDYRDSGVSVDLSDFKHVSE